MDKILLVLVGGSLLGLFALISTLAISIGLVIQGVFAGVLGLVFGWVILLMLAD